MKNNSEQIIELIQSAESERDLVMIRTQKQEMKLHTVFFDEEIGKPSKYRDLIHLLFQADEYDQFIFIMNSPGGYLSSTVAIIEAIKATEANVRAIVVGECHSGASMITLNCHNIVITDSATMLCHTANGSSEGQTSNVQAHANFTSKHVKSLIDKTYLGFMTSEEISDLNKGLEFWFDAKDIKKRLKNKIISSTNIVQRKTKKVNSEVEE